MAKKLRPADRPAHPWAGLFYGFLGVFSFSLTLPATRLALASFDPITVGLGRELVAAVIAAVVLIATRQPLPTARQFRSLLVVSVGAVILFPLFVALGMTQTDASHGAVVLGLLPVATALAGVVRTGERPSWMFWMASAVGSLTVVVFSLSKGDGILGMGDAYLVAAVVFSAFGYAEGGYLGRDMDGWVVISWAIVLAVPALLPPVAYMVWKNGLSGTTVAWAGFAYVSLFSAYLGFFGWFHGLAVGGIARVSQLQLIQPFLTLGFAVLLLGEKFTASAVVAATIVALSILVSRQSKIH